MTATFVTRALYGPPRPVLVLSVSGEVDRGNDDELRRQLRRTADIRGNPYFHEHYGCRELATAVVVDLREATFVAGHALACLARERDGSGRPLRLVVGARGAVRRALTAAGLDDAVELYDDVADAVLADSAASD
ncbi:STAS domain-containing protein [Actinomycetospora endophytica]|uniref:STAS domain-containing protein n=1 Tax=Actinomycetospora endophytica TaxID=2291215 RepID=A0ABS8PFK9_9PSEU|nr:STAS domain-containing protein [Actinomycetospora endophytica]MCD2196295.1 STAS domain-containing protein [Actinomycetospora endophytica]